MFVFQSGALRNHRLVEAEYCLAHLCHVVDRLGENHADAGDGRDSSQRSADDAGDCDRLGDFEFDHEVTVCLLDRGAFGGCDLEELEAAEFAVPRCIDRNAVGERRMHLVRLFRRAVHHEGYIQPTSARRNVGDQGDFVFVVQLRLRLGKGLGVLYHKNRGGAIVL